MMLHEKNIELGNWLFRWRSYVPLVFLIFLVFSLYEFYYLNDSHTFDLIWEFFCLFVSFLGLYIRAYAIAHVPKNTSGRNTKIGQIADTLNTSGMYSISRNPLYLGNFFMMFGITLFVHLWWISLLFVLYFWIYYEKIIYAEELFLVKKFGNMYIEYANKTPVFIPNFSLWQKPELSFSLKNILRREYNGFFAIIVSFVFLELIGNYKVLGKIYIDTTWLTIFIISLTSYLILRFLKRKTKILQVDGR